ncbi:MAG: P-loop NTPase, partial [Oscillospiraceae bacterium]
SERTAPQSLLEPLNKNSSVKKVIGVVSGKGGVGKSLVTAMLAVLTQRKGYRAAILDADITGPSIPKVFGIHKKAAVGENGILPAETKFGTKVMSINLLLEHEGDPVVWRGPIISGVVKQFWTDVNWGNIDYMFVDMPPGTGDVPLTVFQSLPIVGIIVVASPQELVEMIVEKAVRMAGMMKVPVLGLVENMAYFKCPTCHDKHFIFGQSHIAELATRFQIDSTAQIPIAPALTALCDQGSIESFTGNWLDQMIQTITQQEAN